MRQEAEGVTSEGPLARPQIIGRSLDLLEPNAMPMTTSSTAKRLVIVPSDEFVKFGVRETVISLVVNDAGTAQTARTVGWLSLGIAEHKRDEREAALLGQVQNLPNALEVAAMNPVRQ